MSEKKEIRPPNFQGLYEGEKAQKDKMSYTGPTGINILRTKGEKGVLFPAQLIQSTHQSTVNSLALPLGKKAPRVCVGGNRYAIEDFFPVPILMEILCDFAAYDSSQQLNSIRLKKVIRRVNSMNEADSNYNFERRIHIASVPEKVSLNIISAQQGGCIHEAGHCLYSKNEPLEYDEIEEIVLPRWRKVKNWAPYKKLMLQLGNVFEDIHIERILCATFPGVRPKMAALQDFILTMEDKFSQKDPFDNPLTILLCLIRDVGLGYRTHLQRVTVNRHKQNHPEIYDFVIHGPGSAVLKSAIPSLKNKNDIEKAERDQLKSLRLTLDFVDILENYKPFKVITKSRSNLKRTGSTNSDSNSKRPDQNNHSVKNTQQGKKSQTQNQTYPEKQTEKHPEKIQPKIHSKNGAELVLTAIHQGETPKILDYAQALDIATKKALEHEMAEMKNGEMPWRPLSTEEDRIIWPTVRQKTREAGRALSKSVKTECAYMLARLRQTVMGEEEVLTEDGCRKGKKLSIRHLTDTYIQAVTGKRPLKAFRTTEERERPSTAACVVMDESGSMSGILAELGKVAASIAMPLDALGAKVMVHGIRSGFHLRGKQQQKNAHRRYSVFHDIIKGFDEPYRLAEPRFTRLCAIGGTPLADGIEFAMDNLRFRDEQKKIIFVVTDGFPNQLHLPVIRRQIRICKERNIHLIGVGITKSAAYVQSLFPDSVWAESVKELPKKMVKKLNAMMKEHKLRKIH